MGPWMIRWMMVPVLFIIASAAAARAEDSGDLRYLGADEKTGTSRAIVMGDVAMVYTDQLFPIDTKGRIVGNNDLAKQFEAVLEKLAQLLVPAESDLDHLVRLNIYVSNRCGSCLQKHRAGDQAIP